MVGRAKLNGSYPSEETAMTCPGALPLSYVTACAASTGVEPVASWSLRVGSGRVDAGENFRRPSEQATSLLLSAPPLSYGCAVRASDGNRTRDLLVPSSACGACCVGRLEAIAFLWSYGSSPGKQGAL